MQYRTLSQTHRIVRCKTTYHEYSAAWKCLICGSIRNIKVWGDQVETCELSLTHSINSGILFINRLPMFMCIDALYVHY